MKSSQREFIKHGALFVPAMAVLFMSGFSQAQAQVQAIPSRLRMPAQIRIPGFSGSTGGGGGGGGIALVNSVCGPSTPGSGGGPSAVVDMTGANFFVLYNLDNTGVETVSSSPANTWVALTSGQDNLYYAASASSSSAMTFDVSGGGQYPGFCVMGFSGVAATPYETGTFQTATVTSFPAATTTPTGTGQQLIVSGANCGVGDTTMNAVTPFLPSTAIRQPFTPSQGFGVSMAYATQTGNAPITATWSQSPLLCGSAHAMIAVFQ